MSRLSAVMLGFAFDSSLNHIIFVVKGEGYSYSSPAGDVWHLHNHYVVIRHACTPPHTHIRGAAALIREPALGLWGQSAQDVNQPTKAMIGLGVLRHPDPGAQ